MLASSTVLIPVGSLLRQSRRICVCTFMCTETDNVLTLSRWTVEGWGLQQALGSSHLSLWTNIAKERRKSTEQEDQSVNRLTIMYFFFCGHKR